MSKNSLSNLLGILEQYPVTLGWGAVFAFSRERINRMLEQQFTAAFNASRFIAPCSGVVSLGGGAPDVTLSSMVFGAPVLSFEVAALDRAAKLTIPLLSGEYKKVEESRAGALRAVSGGNIRMNSQVALTMYIDLEEIGSDSDNTGRICFDLGKARDPTCNLYDEPVLQAAIGKFLLDYLNEQPPHQTNFVLALVDAGNYDPLNPVRFAIRTQAAPGAAEPGALNAGDGAVLVFMKLQGLDDDDTELPGTDYPYLIPDDTANGEPLYSASLFVSRWLTHFVNDANLIVLKNSVLPDGYTFAESSGGRYAPNDTAIFGHLEATRANLRIEPAVADLEIMHSLDLVARRGDGSTVDGVTWSTSCLNSPLLKGSITSSGRFSADNYAFRGPSVLLTTVTARYTENGRPAEATGLVLVRYADLAVDPLISTVAPGDVGVELDVQGYGATTGVSWTALAPALGFLEAPGQGLEAAYIPPAKGGVPLVAQRIDVRNERTGSSKQAVVMLAASPTTLPVDPPFIGAVYGQGEIEFEVPQAAVRALLQEANGAAEEGVFWRWSVVGEGSVVADGRTARFIPPATRTTSTLSVLICELLGPDVDYLCGFAVVEQTMASIQEEPHWEQLQSFRVEVPDGSQVFANGMQQIPVKIRIETKPITVDGEQVLIPVNAVELATLKLINRESKTEVPFIDPNQDGIEENDTSTKWATSLRRNRFKLFNPNARDDSGTPAATNEEGVTYSDLYVHIKNHDQALELYAQFIAQDNRVMSSLDYGEDATESVSVKGVLPPAIGLGDYTFERKRVWHEGGQPDGDDDFSYIPRSIDFWTLAFRKGNFDASGFATLRVDNNTSTIQWESELLDETYFSKTTFALYPKHRLDPPSPTEMSFDPYLGALMHEVGHSPPDTDFHSYPPSPGELTVGLQRLDDVTYWYDGQAHDNKAKLFRKRLDKPVLFNMLDENGTRHRVQIGFSDPSLEGSRNHLNLILR